LNSIHRCALGDSEKIGVRTTEVRPCPLVATLEKDGINSSFCSRGPRASGILFDVRDNILSVSRIAGVHEDYIGRDYVNLRDMIVQME
jgi:hypothetical protein